MKICPKCGAGNKDKQRLCTNCDAYLGNVETETDENYAEKAIARSNRKNRIRFILFTSLFVLFYCVFMIFTMTLCYDIDGNLNRYFSYSLLYIPCLILFFFPYNKVYCWYRRKRKLVESYLSDHIIVIFRAISWIYLLFLYIGTFDMMNVVS